jgi:hypothetical protein
MPNSISAIYSYLGEHPDVDMVIGGHINRRPDGREKISSPSHFQESPCARIADYLIHKRISLCHGSFVVSKELLAKRPYPESLRKREDIPVFAYLLAYANIACIEHVMVRVNKHTTSLRHRDFGEDSENPADLVAEVFKSLPEACQPIRCSYAAIRYQAAFRNALARRCWDEARRLLLESLRHDWKRALSLANMHKAGRALLMGRGQR